MSNSHKQLEHYYFALMQLGKLFHYCVESWPEKNGSWRLKGYIEAKYPNAEKYFVFIRFIISIGIGIIFQFRGSKNFESF